MPCTVRTPFGSGSPPLESTWCWPLPAVSRPDSRTLGGGPADKICVWGPLESDRCGDSVSRRGRSAPDLGGRDEAGGSRPCGASPGKARASGPEMGSASRRVPGVGGRLRRGDRRRAGAGPCGDRGLRLVLHSRAPCKDVGRPVLRLFRPGRVSTVLDTFLRGSPLGGCFSGDPWAPEGHPPTS